MKRKAVLAAGTLVSLVLTTLSLPSRAEEKENEHLRGRSDVFPGTATMKASEAVAWINYSGTSVEIRFDKETVKQLQCKEQSPFQMTEGDAALSSGEVRSSEVVTLCQLEPAEYEYTVRWRHSPMEKISVSQ